MSRMTKPKASLVAVALVALAGGLAAGPTTTQADVKWWAVPAEARNAFLDACARGDEQAVRRFLKPYPALVHARGTSHDRGTALVVAAYEGKTEVVRALIEHGADLEAEDRAWGTSALGWAAYWGRVPAVKALLDAGAEVNHPNRLGRTPLYNVKAGARAHPDVASDKAREQVAQLLTERGGTEEQQDRKRPWPAEVPPQERQALGEQQEQGDQ